MDKIYDVIILGAGPGGLAAGIYAGRARLDTLLIEKGKDGGQIAITDEKLCISFTNDLKIHLNRLKTRKKFIHKYM